MTRLAWPHLDPHVVLCERIEWLCQVRSLLVSVSGLVERDNIAQKGSISIWSLLAPAAAMPCEDWYPGIVGELQSVKPPDHSKAALSCVMRCLATVHSLQREWLGQTSGALQQRLRKFGASFQ